MTYLCRTGVIDSVMDHTYRRGAVTGRYVLDPVRALRRLPARQRARVVVSAIQRRLAYAAYRSAHREDRFGRPTTRGERIALGKELKRAALVRSASEAPVRFGVAGEVVHVEDTRGVIGDPRRYWGGAK